MAIEKRGDSCRAYWRNPHTKKIEKGAMRATLAEAQFDDDEVKFRLKHQPWTFEREAAREVEATVLTFKAAADAYLARTDLEETTRKTAHSSLRPAVKMLGKVAAAELSRTDLRRYEASFASTDNKQSTIHRRIKLVRMVLGWARATGLIEEHKVDGHKVKRGKKNPDPPPTPDEVRRICEVAPRHIRRGILLSYYLGLRFGPSETLSVTWADFDAMNATLTVRCAKNKERPWRQVCIAQELLKEMLAWQAEDAGKDVPTIVHWRGKVIKTCWTSWEKARKAAGVTRPMTLYRLRHSFATQALLGGADLKATAASMGHQDTTMLLDVYQTTLDQQRRDVAASVQDVLGSRPGVQNGVQEGSQMGLGGNPRVRIVQQ